MAKSSKLSKAKVPGYKLIGNIRSGKMGGGTGLLIHNSLQCRQRKDLELDTEIFEHTVVELETDTKNVLLVSGYRPPIKPDTPINVYTRFCLNTAKSKFSLVSPVADW